MRGKHHIVIESTRLKYEFDICRNITILRGDSATGKTTLIELLQAYSQLGTRSGISVQADVPCIVYSGDSNAWNQVIPTYHASIIFIDENYRFIATKEFAEVIQKTDNYYVLITRKDLICLPYSIKEIYGIKTSGRYHFPQKIYHTFYRIYRPEEEKDFQNSILITEDKNSGFQFFSHAFPNTKCISADGNGNIYKKIMELKDQGRPLVVIADGAAFGAFINKVLEAAKLTKGAMMYLPESFEWLVLRSGIIQSKSIQEILESPEKYIESSKYFSWEQYFTQLLKQETEDKPYCKYQKSLLPEFYMTAANQNKILAVMPQEVKDVL
jgi:hypothetical protein